MRNKSQPRTASDAISRKGVAVSGSDLYLREGSDVSLVFHLGKRGRFVTAVAPFIERARTAIEMTMLERIQRHISSRLDSPDLQAEALSGLFGISRTRLYRLFEPLGGVARYIQEQRLGRAYAELSNPALNHRRIYEIAFGLGFSSEAHFSRIFRSTFRRSARTFWRSPAIRWSGRRGSAYCMAGAKCCANSRLLWAAAA